MARSTSVGPCGLYCGSCPINLAGDYPELKARLSKTLHCREEEVTCNGCRELTEACWGNRCKIKLCAEQGGFSYCFECSRFPCSNLKKLATGYREMPLQQLREIREMGAEEFRSLLHKRWTCSCGHPISSFTRKCIRCQE